MFLDENSIIKAFSIACFSIMIVFTITIIYLEIIGESSVWLGYQAFEFSIYGIFALGLYKIIKLLSQLVGEMKFFRHHYILKDRKKKKENE